MILDVDSDSMTGLVRKVNEDAVFSSHLHSVGLFAVADGMGGHFQGEVASNMAVNGLSRWWEQQRTQIEDLPFYTVVESLEKEIRNINLMITEHYFGLKQVGGCTLCVLLLHCNAYAVFNIGDSRLYLYGKKKLKRLTIDDVWENLPKVRQMTDIFDLSGDARRGRLSRAVGLSKDMSPVILTNAIEKKMIFFLCSDGVYKHMSERQLCNLLKKVKKAGDAVCVNKKIRGIVYRNGAPDNLSMVTVLAEEKCVFL